MLAGLDSRQNILRRRSEPKKLWIDPSSVVPNPQSKLLPIITDFNLDLTGSRVPEGVSQRLACNSIGFVPRDWLVRSLSKQILDTCQGFANLLFDMAVSNTQMLECHGLIVRELKPDGTPALELAGRSNRNCLIYGNLIFGFAL